VLAMNLLRRFGIAEKAAGVGRLPACTKAHIESLQISGLLWTKSRDRSAQSRMSPANGGRARTRTTPECEGRATSARPIGYRGWCDGTSGSATPGLRCGAPVI
jgi:hypothetical protein